MVCTFSDNQINESIDLLRKKIFFLLVIGDPKTKEEYKDIDVVSAFENVLNLIDGYNELLNYPRELVDVASYLTDAKNEYLNNSFNFKRYRKLILDSGNLILKIKEVR